MDDGVMVNYKTFILSVLIMDKNERAQQTSLTGHMVKTSKDIQGIPLFQDLTLNDGKLFILPSWWL